MFKGKIFHVGVLTAPQLDESGIRLISNSSDAEVTCQIGRKVLDGHHLAVKLDLDTTNTTANNYLDVVLEFDDDVTVTQKENETPAASNEKATVQFLLPTTSTRTHEGCVFKIAGVDELRAVMFSIKSVSENIGVNIYSAVIEYSEFWDNSDVYNLKVDA